MGKKRPFVPSGSGKKEPGPELGEKQIWKPGALLAPIPPALVSCGTLEAPNVLTVAWTGIVATHPPLTYISLRPERYSYGLIRESGEFVVNLTTEALVRAADFCGARSGRTVDKMKEMKLTPLAASIVSAPLIAESPVHLECRVRQVIPLGSHDMFLSDIVAVQVDERCLNREGKLCLSRCGLAAFAHGEYFALGRSLGTFGFSVRKRPASARRASVQRTERGKRN
ncbi:MAG: flavin reductase family protein [Provencibacterium sp.]|jgi:flavin reductase (DIM6/NTAB) family NADH-FMN oxidoreductase RutF|nr:flavin reductase family protein [Provencibacterium sp.]